jgi:hypothetical protein
MRRLPDSIVWLTQLKHISTFERNADLSVSAYSEDKHGPIKWQTMSGVMRQFRHGLVTLFVLVLAERRRAAKRHETPRLPNELLVMIAELL